MLLQRILLHFKLHFSYLFKICSSACSSSENWKVNEASSSFLGKTRCPSKTKILISPKAAFNRKLGTGAQHGLRITVANVLAKSCIFTGFGAVKFTAPCSSSVSMQ